MASTHDDGERSDEDGKGEGSADSSGDGDAAVALDAELKECDHGPVERHVHRAQQFDGESLHSMHARDAR